MASEQGRQFGRYELQARIGRGGMAETWRARLMGAAGVTKPVLIKKVLPEFANDEAFISMFISEARISATLSHGSIAQVFDFGRVDGEYFLAMEYVEGQPLHRILKRALRAELTCLPTPMATYIAMEMCRGLHYAHTRTDEKGAPLGIVHRDISPDNVLISYEGQVKIVDFGIAKARSLRSFDTAPGVVKGKYLFFSPEQARGETVDARTDVWATGVVLFNMLCGRLPLEGPEYVVMRRLTQRQPVPRPRDVRPDLPARLDAILQKALAVKREDRFESAHALGDALAGFLYTSAPRFSAMSVAYLLRELFRPELTAEGRDTKVPASFLEELSVWRSAPALPRPTEPGRPQLTGEIQTEESHPPALPALPAPREPAEDAEDRAPEGGSVTDGLRASHVLVGAGILTLLVLAWVAFDRVRAEWGAPEGDGPPSPASSPQPLAPPPTSTAKAAPAKPSGAEPAAPDSATWPVDTFQLEARRHVFRVSSGRAALGTLEPDVEWRIAETTLPLSFEERGQPMPTLFYFLTGGGVSANAAVGFVSRKPEAVRGASGLMLFTVGAPTAQDNLPERAVTATNTKTGQGQRLIVHPEWMTTDVDRAFLFKGLSPEETYRLTVEPVGEGAFTRGRERGPALTVACVQQVTEEDLPQTPPARAGRFLLAQGEEVRLNKMRGLHCGFVDDDPADNEGAVRVRVEKSRPLSERAAEGTRADATKAAPAQRSGARAALASAPGAGTNLPARGAEPEWDAQEDPAARLFARAQALLRTRQPERALAAARECLERVPTHADCLLVAGSAAARSGRMEEGARYYRRFLEVAPADHPHASRVLRLVQEYESR
ncbi:protein kinase [Myxococcus sp. RHSTA-1-4]|uniref:protein kinase domain-containing protein n=1 Tax=Myxococcus sp. RHSTA-1-4 TaxID=2874601 RepID=UPI00351D864E|nr:protein kinase [Myxococcus sp. RHSTA-1-4]